MHRILLFACIVGCGGSDSSSADAAPEANPFLGSWSVVQFDGKPQDGALVWTFGPTDVAINSGGFSGTYTFDAGASPNRITVAITGAQPNPNAAIYKFDSDTRFAIKLQDGATAAAATFDVEAGYDVLEMSKLSASAP